MMFKVLKYFLFLENIFCITKVWMNLRFMRKFLKLGHLKSWNIYKMMWVFGIL